MSLIGGSLGRIFGQDPTAFVLNVVGAAKRHFVSLINRVEMRTGDSTYQGKDRAGRNITLSLHSSNSESVNLVALKLVLLAQEHPNTLKDEANRLRLGLIPGIGAQNGAPVRGLDAQVSAGHPSQMFDPTLGQYFGAPHGLDVTSDQVLGMLESVVGLVIQFGPMALDALIAGQKIFGDPANAPAPALPSGKAAPNGQSPVKGAYPISTIPPEGAYQPGQGSAPGPDEGPNYLLLVGGAALVGLVLFS